jgi:hypothetical protein
MWQDTQGRWICFTCVLFYYGHIRAWAEENPPAPPPLPPSRVHYWEFDEPPAA